MHEALADSMTAIADLCRTRGVRRLEVFGSAARGVDFDRTRSDVDLLVDFAATPTLTEFFEFREKLRGILGRPVDLVMSFAIRNPFIAADIERSKETLYAT
jgi:predicted nucleotidyltransferase